MIMRFKKKLNQFTVSARLGSNLKALNFSNTTIIQAHTSVTQLQGIEHELALAHCQVFSFLIMIIRKKNLLCVKFINCRREGFLQTPLFLSRKS